MGLHISHLFDTHTTTCCEVSPADISIPIMQMWKQIPATVRGGIVTGDRTSCTTSNSMQGWGLEILDNSMLNILTAENKAMTSFLTYQRSDCALVDAGLWGQDRFLIKALKCQCTYTDWSESHIHRSLLAPILIKQTTKVTLCFKDKRALIFAVRPKSSFSDSYEDKLQVFQSKDQNFLPNVTLA